MAQHNPDEVVSFDEVLRLVHKLSAEEREELRLKLNQDAKVARFNEICENVQQTSKDLPPLSDEEIVAEVKKVRTGFLEYLRNQPGSNL
jgi:hypothetical protein